MFKSVQRLTVLTEDFNDFLWSPQANVRICDCEVKSLLRDAFWDAD
jgi:hypothetical protein